VTVPSVSEGRASSAVVGCAQRGRLAPPVWSIRLSTPNYEFPCGINELGIIRPELFAQKPNDPLLDDPVR
jgi:hypothetical protein